jgi:hypothetical protein
MTMQLGLAALLVMLGPPIAGWALRRTRVWWLTGFVMMVAAVLLVGTMVDIPDMPRNDEPSFVSAAYGLGRGFLGFVNSLIALGSIGLFGYGAVTLVCSRIARVRACEELARQPPTASALRPKPRH